MGVPAQRCISTDTNEFHACFSHLRLRSLRELGGSGNECAHSAVHLNPRGESNACFINSICLYRLNDARHLALREVRHQMSNLDPLRRRVNQLLNAYLADPCPFTLECYSRALRRLHTLRGDENE